MSYLRTALSWGLYQLGRLMGCIVHWLDRDWMPRLVAIPLVYPPAHAYQVLMCWSAELDREGRVWEWIGEEETPCL